MKSQVSKHIHLLVDENGNRNFIVTNEDGDESTLDIKNISADELRLLANFVESESQIETVKRHIDDDKQDLLDGVCTAKELYKAIKEEVRETFEEDEFCKYETSEDFFKEIDVINGYEPYWEERKHIYKPFYMIIWSEIKSGKIKL
ncbi:hypothetical protein A3715_20175 [Oleiphilus sp. HI0009]|nr:hypothetical protein A3715_20185 [Oleiphilus sp. HI0009]KZX78333.1 hypothetical protein A3715_20175 [Oleiphilus sp. HI0009]